MAHGFSAARPLRRESFQGRGAVGVLGFSLAEGFVGDEGAAAGGAEAGGVARGAGFAPEGGSAEV